MNDAGSFHQLDAELKYLHREQSTFSVRLCLNYFPPAS